MSKAGQGAFGSVYVALWKGLVVAVKVIRQQSEGRRAMRTAWELAVTKSVNHPNIVMVRTHAHQPAWHAVVSTSSTCNGFL